MTNPMQIMINTMTKKAIDKAVLVYRTLKSSSSNSPCNQTCVKCGNSDVHRHYHKAGEEIIWSTGFSSKLKSADRQELLQRYCTFITSTCTPGKDFKFRQEAIKHCCRSCQFKWLSNVIRSE